MTIKVMRDFGVEIEETESGYFIKGNQKYQQRDYFVESDWSQAAFFLVGGAISGDVTLKGSLPEPVNVTFFPSAAATGIINLNVFPDSIQYENRG